MDSIFIDTISQYNMLFSGCKVFIALSGGADSVVLLYKMKEIQSQYGLTLEAIHVNHYIRGIEADNDEKFCIGLCEKLNIDINVYKVDIPALAKQKRLGIEECARNARYEYFYKMLKEKKFDFVATAHNSNDNAETVLFNMIRGSGLRGLCGIPPVRDKIIRPLIECSKSQILHFAKENDIRFVFDKTNDDKKYTRNYIRHEIIPKALELNPSFLESAQRMCKLLSIDDDYLTNQADEFINKALIINGHIVFCIIDLIDLHDSILSRVIMKCYDKISKGNQLSFANIKVAIDTIRKNDGNKVIMLPKNIIIEILYDKIIFKKQNKTIAHDFYYEIKNDEDDIFFEQSEITIKYKIESNKQFTKKDGIVNINYDIIKGNLFFRNRKANDGFVPLGGVGTKSVKKMLIDNKIPREKRDFLPVLCCDNEVIWVFGLDRINNKFKPDKDTKKILRLFIKKGGSFFESGY